MPLFQVKTSDIEIKSEIKNGSTNSLKKINNEMVRSIVVFLTSETIKNANAWVTQSSIVETIPRVKCVNMAVDAISKKIMLNPTTTSL